MKKLLFFVLLASAASLSCGPGTGGAQTDGAGLLASTCLPDLGGNLRSLREYCGAAGVMLTFVDTRCEFAERVGQEVSYAAFGLIPYEIRTVVVNSGDPAPAVQRAYADGIAGAAVVYDTSRLTAQRWNVASMPTVLLLDADGNNVYRGAPVWNKVERALARHLGLAPGSVCFRPPEPTGG